MQERQFHHFRLLLFCFFFTPFSSIIYLHAARAEYKNYKNCTFFLFSLINNEQQKVFHLFVCL